MALWLLGLLFKERRLHRRGRHAVEVLSEVVPTNLGLFGERTCTSGTEAYPSKPRSARG